MLKALEACLTKSCAWWSKVKWMSSMTTTILGIVFNGYTVHLISDSQLWVEPGRYLRRTVMMDFLKAIASCFPSAHITMVVRSLVVFASASMILGSEASNMKSLVVVVANAPAEGVGRGRFGRGRGELRKVRERRDREEEACHLQWSFPHVAHWEVGGSGRTAEEMRDRVTGVCAFRALWSRLSSYAVPVVSYGWGQTRAELGEGRAVCPGEAPLRGRDCRRADFQQPVWGEGGDGGGNSVRVHPLEGLAIGVGLRDAIDEVGGDQRSEKSLVISVCDRQSNTKWLKRG